MSSISNCSCQCIKDTRTALSLAVSGIAATAILVTLVALGRLHDLPPISYPIAGASFVFTLLIGTLVATIRCNKPQKSISANQLATSSHSATPLPTLEDVMRMADSITLDTQEPQSFPPTEDYPFITAQFNFIFTVGNNKWKFPLRVRKFYEGFEGRIFAEIAYKGGYQVILIRQVKNYTRDEYPSTTSNNPLPSEAYLNQRIKLEGYISYVTAWNGLAYQLENNKSNRSAFYFASSIESNQAIFQVPNLVSAEHKGSIVTFTRDSSQPLINQEQIELLKRSDVSWHKNLAAQLESPQWIYQFETSILSVTQTGNEVVVITS